MSVLRYGQICHLKNGHQNWQGGYLDACGRARCGDNLYEVSTAKTPTRAPGTGSWKIVSATGKKDGAPVMANDQIHLQNQYGKKGYLDACGKARCGGNLYEVSVAKTPTRAAGTGTWKIIPEHDGEVHEDEAIHLQNGYQNWQGGYLDACGRARCGDNLYEVSTGSKLDRVGLTSQWQFHVSIDIVEEQEPAAEPAKPEPARAPAKVEITFIHSHGVVKRTQSDEYVEVTNTGGTAADISGWLLNAGDRKQDFTFPDGTTLEPRQSVRIYTNEIHPETGGFSFGSGRPIWNDQGGDIGVLFDAQGTEVSRRSNELDEAPSP